MKLGLPRFNPSTQQRQWVESEMETARFIEALWNASGRKRHDPGFVSLLVRCGWTNVGDDDRGWESTRVWRNRILRITFRSHTTLISSWRRSYRVSSLACAKGRHSLVPTRVSRIITSHCAQRRWRSLIQRQDASLTPLRSRHRNISNRQ